MCGERSSITRRTVVDCLPHTSRNERRSTEVCLPVLPLGHGPRASDIPTHRWRCCLCDVLFNFRTLLATASPLPRGTELLPVGTTRHEDAGRFPIPNMCRFEPIRHPASTTVRYSQEISMAACRSKDMQPQCNGCILRHIACLICTSSNYWNDQTWNASSVESAFQPREHGKSSALLTLELLGIMPLRAVLGRIHKTGPGYGLPLLAFDPAPSLYEQQSEERSATAHASGKQPESAPVIT